MKNPFKKPKTLADIPPIKEEAKPAPEIKTVIGYLLDGAIYPSPEEARKAYILARIKGLVTSNNPMYGHLYSSDTAKGRFEELDALFLEKIPVKPLFGSDGQV